MPRVATRRPSPTPPPSPFTRPAFRNSRCAGSSTHTHAPPHNHSPVPSPFYAFLSPPGVHIHFSAYSLLAGAPRRRIAPQPDFFPRIFVRKPRAPMHNARSQPTHRLRTEKGGGARAWNTYEGSRFTWPDARALAPPTHPTAPGRGRRTGAATRGTAPAAMWTRRARCPRGRRPGTGCTPRQPRCWPAWAPPLRLHTGGVQERDRHPHRVCAHGLGSTHAGFGGRGRTQHGRGRVCGFREGGGRRTRFPGRRKQTHVSAWGGAGRDGTGRGKGDSPSPARPNRDQLVSRATWALDSRNKSANAFTTPSRDGARCVCCGAAAIPVTTMLLPSSHSTCATRATPTMSPTASAAPAFEPGTLVDKTTMCVWGGGRGGREGGPVRGDAPAAAPCPSH